MNPHSNNPIAQVKHAVSKPANPLAHPKALAGGTPLGAYRPGSSGGQSTTGFVSGSGASRPGSSSDQSSTGSGSDLGPSRPGSSHGRPGSVASSRSVDNVLVTSVPNLPMARNVYDAEPWEFLPWTLPVPPRSNSKTEVLTAVVSKSNLAVRKAAPAGNAKPRGMPRGGLPS